ncbi:MAG: hypothetical protein AUG49_26675 [Catenulispora sp. 13_1_20CM_3_70_7]|nr:MAG: hypothetical protein AUG49_26675 [Catenulispora sp. 13_1_20CM_3_70_7]
MSDLFDTARAGAQDLADRITPQSPMVVRALGDRRRHRRAASATALALAGVVTAGGVAFAVSGSGSHGPTGVPPGTTSTPGWNGSSSAPRQVPSTSSSPSAGVPTSTTPSATTSSSPAAPAACAPDALTVTLTDQIGRTGHTIALLVFQNTGSTPCRLSGYPQVAGIDTKGKTTTTAAHTLTGWAGARITAVPTVDLAPGGYGSAGIEWLNETVDGGPCARVADFDVTPPTGESRIRIPVGAPSLTNGPACAGFQVHPVVSGIEPGYDLGPWLSGYELPFTSSIRWGARSKLETHPADLTAAFVGGPSGCRMFSAPYHGPDAAVQTVSWQNEGKNLDERVATETLLTFPTAADAQNAFAYVKAGAVASTCHSVAAMNPMTTTVLGTIVSSPDGVSDAQTYVQGSGPGVDGLRTHLHYYVVHKNAVVAVVQVEGSNSTTDDTSHDAAVLNAMAAHLS